MLELEQLLKGFTYIFTWTYKDLKGIPLELAQQKIELDTTIPSAHQTKYKLNPNYATTIKQNIDKLLAIGFIEYVEETTWLFTHNNNTKKKWQVKNLYRFQKTKCSHKEGCIPITIHK